MRRFALGLLVLVACGKEATPAADDKKAQDTKAPAAKPTPAPDTKLNPPADAAHAGLHGGDEDEPTGPTMADPTTLGRAAQPSEIGAKGAKSLGFQMSALAGLYAIEAAVAPPDWGRIGKKPLAVRDDDLNTAWTCELIEEAPCAIGLEFEDEATVGVIRIHSAAGPSWSDYQNHPRIAKVRIHTEAGYFDAELEDGAGHRYVRLDAMVPTKTLTIEVTGVHGGPKEGRKELHINELDVFGAAGRPRPPLSVDPQAVFAQYDTTPWKEGEKNTIRQVFLTEALGDGKMRRLFRGTALLGHKDDRFLLIEKLFDTDCENHDGRYLLLDQISRLVIPLGQVTGAPLPMARHGEGLGFATIASPDDPFGFTAAVYEDGTIKQRKPSERQRKGTPQELLEQWGFTDLSPLARGAGTKLSAPPKDCQTADPERVAASKIAGKIRGKTGGFVECKVDGGHAVLGESEDCGKSWAIVVLGDDGSVVGEAVSDKKSPGRGLRLARLDAAGLVVETTSQDGARGTLHTVSGKGIEVLAEAASFATRLPSKCDACKDEFVPSATAVAEPGDDGTKAEAEPPEVEASADEGDSPAPQ
jgi:hypothetical protein